VNNIEVSKNTLKVAVENEYKKRIQSLGLVKTGTMLRSIKAVIKTQEELDISIESTDYFKKFDLEYNITDYVLKQPSVIKAIDDVISDMIFKDSF